MHLNPFLRTILKAYYWWKSPLQNNNLMAFKTRKHFQGAGCWINSKTYFVCLLTTVVRLEVNIILVTGGMCLLGVWWVCSLCTFYFCLQQNHIKILIFSIDTFLSSIFRCLAQHYLSICLTVELLDGHKCYRHSWVCMLKFMSLPPRFEGWRLANKTSVKSSFWQFFNHVQHVLVTIH